MSSLYYKRIGKGKTALVLLHGFLGSHAIWEEYTETLSTTYTILLIDLPGHGNSAVGGECTSMFDMASEVHDIMHNEHISSAHFCGHSMGGYVALALAHAYPEKVHSITLMNSTARGDTEQKKKDRVLAARIFDINPDIFIQEAIQNLFYPPNLAPFHHDVERLKLIALKTPPKGAQASLLGMRDREDMVKWLYECQLPIHYIAGKQDNTVLYTSIEEQIKDLNAHLTAFDNCGHMAFVEKKVETLQAMLRYWETNF
jgi:pimeloyl-ACP methyl ester carboxylesterase